MSSSYAAAAVCSVTYFYHWTGLFIITTYGWTRGGRFPFPLVVVVVVVAIVSKREGTWIQRI